MNVLSIITIVAIAVAISIAQLAKFWRRIVIMDYQKGVLYKNGKFERLLEAGKHRIWMRSRTLSVFDLRARVLTVPGQEILSVDNVSLKVSAAFQYRIENPEVMTRSALSVEALIYLEVQLAMRDLFSVLPVEEIITQRDKLSVGLKERMASRLPALGLALDAGGIKDIMFPGPVRQMFSQVVEARKAAQASLEKARGESATLRHLANAARMLENNPALVTLKTLQTVSEGKHTLVMGLPQTVIPVSQPGTSKEGGSESSKIE